MLVSRKEKDGAMMAQMVAKLGVVPLKPDEKTKLGRFTESHIGVWQKDRDASDCMSVVRDIIGLSSLMVQAMNLIRGLEISRKGDIIVVGVFSVLQWFQIHEQYRLDGTVTRCTRRDLRRGGHYGHLTLEGDRLFLRFAWPDPIAGEGYDELVLVNPHELHIISTLKTGNGSCKYTQVFRRQL